MPCDYSKYPSNWKNLRIAILSRAENRCELCGGFNGEKQWKTGGKIVLTIHHINYNTADNRLYNLIALCQRCHNKLDMPLRVDNRKKSKEAK